MASPSYTMNYYESVHNRRPEEPSVRFEGPRIHWPGSWLLLPYTLVRRRLSPRVNDLITDISSMRRIMKDFIRFYKPRESVDYLEKVRVSLRALDERLAFLKRRIDDWLLVSIEPSTSFTELTHLEGIMETLRPVFSEIGSVMQTNGVSERLRYTGRPVFRDLDSKTGDPWLACKIMELRSLFDRTDGALPPLGYY